VPTPARRAMAAIVGGDEEEFMVMNQSIKV
jgi:hypothetical protein